MIIVIVAEIVPQAVFKKHSLKTGAMFAWLVKLLIFVWTPVAWPLSKVLHLICKTSPGTAYKLAGKSSKNHSIATVCLYF